MRTIVKWAVIPALLAAVACRDNEADTDLASDLALITGSDIELANASAPGATVVSAVENIPAPAPRPSPTPSKNRGTKAPPPQETMVDVGAAEPTTTAPELVPVLVSETPEAAEIVVPDAPPVIRPHPIEPRYPIGDESIFGTGSDERGDRRGGTVVIRGGSDGRDPCDIHDRRGRRGRGPSVMIPVAFPGRAPGRVPVGTFPR